MPVYDIQVTVNKDKFRLIVDGNNIADATETAKNAIVKIASPESPERVIVKKVVSIKGLAVIPNGQKPILLGTE